MKYTDPHLNSAAITNIVGTRRLNETSTGSWLLNRGGGGRSEIEIRSVEGDGPEPWALQTQGWYQVGYPQDSAYQNPNPFHYPHPFQTHYYARILPKPAQTQNGNSHKHTIDSRLQQII